MPAVQGEVYEAFRATDIPEDEALEASVALSRRDDDGTGLKLQMAVVEGMLGFVLVLPVAVSFKLFGHRGGPQSDRLLLSPGLGSDMGEGGRAALHQGGVGDIRPDNRGWAKLIAGSSQSCAVRDEDRRTVGAAADGVLIELTTGLRRFDLNGSLEEVCFG